MKKCATLLITKEKQNVKSWSKVTDASEYAYIEISKMSEKFAYYSTSKKSIHFVIEQAIIGIHTAVGFVLILGRIIFPAAPVQGINMAIGAVIINSLVIGMIQTESGIVYAIYHKGVGTGVSGGAGQGTVVYYITGQRILYKKVLNIFYR